MTALEELLKEVEQSEQREKAAYNQFLSTLKQMQQRHKTEMQQQRQQYLTALQSIEAKLNAPLRPPEIELPPELTKRLDALQRTLTTVSQQLALLSTDSKIELPELKNISEELQRIYQEM